MRKNPARNTVTEKLENSVDLWNEIRYLDPDLQCAETSTGLSDPAAIIAALLMLIFVFVVAWSLQVRGL